MLRIFVLKINDYRALLCSCVLAASLDFQENKDN
jgi:hypothetical protein